MARYIDLEELERRIKKNVKPEIPEEKAFVEYYKGECIRQGYAMPVADVAPKSEVERLERILDSYALQYGTATDKQKVIDGAKSEVAREIFEEIEKVVGYALCVDLTDWSAYTELKKKYTEGENEDQRGSN